MGFEDPNVLRQIDVKISNRWLEGVNILNKHTIQVQIVFNLQPPEILVVFCMIKKRRREMLKRILILLMMIVSIPSFATDVMGGETCDTDVLNTDTGPVNLRAEFEPENINLHWYNDGNKITVPTASNSCTYDTPISLPTDPVKPGYKFKGWKVFSNYIPVEYIQGAGTQWIDTGIVLQNATLDTEVMLTTIGEGNPIIGYNYSQNNIQHRMSVGFSSLYDDDDLMVFGYGVSDHGYQYVTSGMTQGTKHHIVAQFTPQNATLTIDGVLKTNVSGGSRQNPISIAIAGCHAPNQNNGIKGRVYSAKIYDGNNVLVRDFIPVKDLSGVACMYDHVSGQFFYNAGTGDFIAGPEI